MAGGSSKLNFFNCLHRLESQDGSCSRVLDYDSQHGIGLVVRDVLVKESRPRTKSTPGSNIEWAKRPRSVRRQRCYGSVELLVSVDESGKIKNVGRFRVEPRPKTKEETEECLSPNTPVIFENPHTETRWYYRYFLGQAHQNFAGIDPQSKTPFFFSVMTADEMEGTCIRAIQWIRTDLGILEDQEGSINFKFGVIFAKPNQHSDDEMLSNDIGSEEFEQFLQLLGHRIELQNWGNFKGGLDTASNSTGKESMYTTFGGHEIMYHVSTLLPHSSLNRQQIEKKRHIGNDIVNIIFESGGDPMKPSFNPSIMKSQFTLINGERAAFNAHVLGAKRERTNDTLIKDMYIEYLKDQHKLLKLEKLLSGEAPYNNSPADASFFRKQPWQPKLLSSNHDVLDVVGSDSWGKSSLLIGTESSGVVLLNESVSNVVVDDEARVQQISVVEPFGFVLFRCDKGRESFIAAVALALLQRSLRTKVPLTRKDCYNSKISTTKGCHLFAVTDCHNLRHSVAVCIGRKILLLRWALGHFGRVLEETNLSKNFTVLKEVTIHDEVSSVFVHETGSLAAVRACVGTKHTVELVDFSKTSVSTLCRLDDSKTVIDSVSVVAEADSPMEIVINYGNTTVIMDPEDNNQDYLKLLWTTKPESVVYVFPYIFAFAQNSMEVRLAINGNLLATHYLPGVQLLASKEHMIFAAEQVQAAFSKRTWSLYRIRSKNRNVSPANIGTTNLAGSRTPNLGRNLISRTSCDSHIMENSGKIIYRQKPIDSRIAVLQLDRMGFRGGSLGSSDSGVGKSRGNSSTSSIEMSVPASPMFAADPFTDTQL